ncbi:2809_t:CDS:2 [Funneliformis mosseae]|uniref:2809_t:CDS:1 n=1 Tax=Funneliformis mosseae TaxID=27381 RepID=A0A9N9GA05_FUNMO|nr:2809_t:CDS:2 [Funneliformis mosseae]
MTDTRSMARSKLTMRIWTQNYKETYELWISGIDKVPSWIFEYKEDHTTITVKLSQRDSLKEGLEMSTTIGTSNMPDLIKMRADDSLKFEGLSRIEAIELLESNGFERFTNTPTDVDLDCFIESWDEQTLSIDESVDDIVDHYSLDRKRSLSIESIDDIMRTLIKGQGEKNVICDYFTPVIVDISPVDQPQSKLSDDENT